MNPNDPTRPYLTPAEAFPDATMVEVQNHDPNLSVVVKLDGMLSGTPVKIPFGKSMVPDELLSSHPALANLKRIGNNKPATSPQGPKKK